LNHARANASANWSGCSRNRREIFSYAGSTRRAISVVSIEGVRRLTNRVDPAQYRPCVTLRLPLVRARRALRQLPFIAEEVDEEVIAPFCGRGGPDDFESAGDCVAALAGAKAVPPAKALLLDASRFGLGPHMGAGAAPWVLPKVWPPAMSATVSSSFIAMRAKVSRDIVSRGHRIGISIGTFRVHVNQAHLHCGERILKMRPLSVRDFSLPCSSASATITPLLSPGFPLP